MIEPIRYEVVQSGVTTMHRAAVGCWDRASSANDACGAPVAKPTGKT